MARRAAGSRKAESATLDHVAEQLRPLVVPLAGLRPDPRNARKHSPANLRAIMESLKRYGQRRPIVALRDGTIVAGHGVADAARTLGWESVAVLVVDDDPETAAGYALADNRTGDLSEWDDAALALVVSDLQASDADLLDRLGYSDAELGKIMAQLDVDEPESPYGTGDSAPVGGALGAEPAPTPLPGVIGGYPDDELVERGKGHSRMDRGGQEVVGIGRWIAGAERERVLALATALDDRFGRGRDERTTAALWVLDTLEAALRG